MDFIDKIHELATRIPSQIEHIQTEEATKNAFVLPFIAALGYNVFDPREVIPEFTADVGTKKGEKVDYAILIDGKPSILFECKWCGADLDKEHASQLSRYFSVTDTRFGVLTNGIVYRFYSDLENAKYNGQEAIPRDQSFRCRRVFSRRIEEIYKDVPSISMAFSTTSH